MGIDLSRMRGDEEFFAWTCARTGMVLHFATGRLNAYLAGIQFPVTQVALTLDLVRDVMTSNGIEADHLLGPVPAGRRDDPVLMLDWGDGTHVVADGSHRLVRRALDGGDEVPAWLVPERVWRRFLIEGVGDEAAWRDHLIEVQRYRPKEGQPR